MIDLSLPVTPQMRKDAAGNEKRVSNGHLGTHFDVMDKVFPLDYTIRKGYIFEVSGEEIGLGDIDLSKAEEDMFIGFASGFADRVPYGSKEYFQDHPVLTEELIKELAKRKISLIGIDFAGVRHGPQHPQYDQYCADRGIFIIENLCHMKEAAGACLVYTFPVNWEGMSGLPCRVCAEKGMEYEKR
ncbi:MAG: cyclase family protein [Erysipelotrichaceae bacterium]|nr:cyclase family protein [Erysipelotrichaceae bacterium]